MQIKIAVGKKVLFKKKKNVPENLKLKSADGGDLLIRGYVQIVVKLISTIGSNTVKMKLNLIIVENLCSSCLIGFIDAAYDNMIGLFREQILLFMKTHPITSITLVGCREDPDQIVLKMAQDLIDSTNNGTVNEIEDWSSEILEYKESEWIEEFGLCRNIISRAELLDFQEPKLVPINYVDDIE